MYTEHSMAPLVGYIATGSAAIAECAIAIRTLEHWNPDAHVFLFTDSNTDVGVIKFKGQLTVKKDAMDAFSGLTRSDMESMPGKIYSSLFTDYCFQKANLLEWMASEVPNHPEGYWYVDSDITMLAPLPSIPDGANAALSPHYIRKADEMRYGTYNSGLVWIKEIALLNAWRGAGHSTSFYEQKALEELAQAAGSELFTFPPHVNFGWWRMFQSPEQPPEIQARFSIFRADKSTGIRYSGAPLQSVHTHWHDTTSATGAFNAWFGAFTKKFESHAPIRAYRQLVGLESSKPAPKQQVNIVAHLTECVKTKTPVSYVKYGDGEFYAAKGTSGKNCDKTPYTAKLGKGVRESFKHFAAQKNAFLGKWDSDRRVFTYFESLVKQAVQWANYHAFIVYNKQDFTAEKLKLYKAIKQSPLQKIYVCNESIAEEAKRMLNIDSIVRVHPSNWFEDDYDAILKQVKDEIKDPKRAIVMTSCGMGAKVLLHDLHKQYPGLLYFDLGSALDFVCGRNDSRGNGKYYTYEELRNYFSELFIGS